MTAITSLVIGASDAIRAEGRCVVITGEHGDAWSIACTDATTAHRLSAAFDVVRESRVAEKERRVALLERMEAVA